MQKISLSPTDWLLGGLRHCITCLFLCTWQLSSAQIKETDPFTPDGEINRNYLVWLYDFTEYDPASIDRKATNDSLEHQVIVVVYYGWDTEIRDLVRKGTSWIRDNDKNPVVPFMIHSGGNNRVVIYADGEKYLIPERSMESAIDLITAENIERILKQY